MHTGERVFGEGALFVFVSIVTLKKKKKRTTLETKEKTTCSDLEGMSKNRNTNECASSDKVEKSL